MNEKKPKQETTAAFGMTIEHTLLMDEDDLTKTPKKESPTPTPANVNPPPPPPQTLLNELQDNRQASAAPVPEVPPAFKAKVKERKKTILKISKRRMHISVLIGVVILAIFFSLQWYDSKTGIKTWHFAGWQLANEKGFKTDLAQLRQNKKALLVILLVADDVFSDWAIKKEVNLAAQENKDNLNTIGVLFGNDLGAQLKTWEKTANFPVYVFSPEQNDHSITQSFLRVFDSKPEALTGGSVIVLNQKNHVVFRASRDGLKNLSPKLREILR
jgi:hypothetical protein